MALLQPIFQHLIKLYFSIRVLYLPQLNYWAATMKKNLITSLGKISFAKYAGDASKPTMVFLHDSFGCIELWRDFPQQLGALSHCPVLVYDRLGYGKSDPFPYATRPFDYLEREAHLLNEIIGLLSLEQVLLFGHSDGGSIALLAAAHYPQKIKGLITVGAHIFVEDLTLRGIQQAEQEYAQGDLKNKLEKYHGTKTEALFRAWADTWNHPEYRNWSIANQLPKISCPALIIQGEHDEFGSAAQVQRMVQGISGPATPFMVPHCGHNPHKEQPKLIWEKSAAFIAGMPY
jgi:pimeloyl-ACP methyl ester carboxylesterase